MKTIVPDGTLIKLSQLAIKLYELFGRAKKGSYKRLDEVLDAVQLVIEGKAPTAPDLAVEKFTKWRTFRIGGTSAKKLYAWLKQRCTVGRWVENMMKCSHFAPHDEDIETIILTPTDFGYKDEPSGCELLSPARLTEWSRLNAERLDGYVVELLPAEAGPHIRDQYQGQPLGDCLWIAMEGAPGFLQTPNIFFLYEAEEDGRPRRCIDSAYLPPESSFAVNQKFVFRLRKPA